MSTNSQKANCTNLNNIQQKKQWITPEVEVISYDSITSGLYAKGSEGLTAPFQAKTPGGQYFS